MNYYANDHTVDFLNSNTRPKVFLIGGFMGFMNFGDILQLKFAINFHKQQTKLEPIIVLRLDSIDSADYIKK